MDERERATKLQIEQATELIHRLKYDMEWYALENMSRGQMCRLLDKLRDDAGRVGIGNEEMPDMRR